MRTALRIETPFLSQVGWSRWSIGASDALTSSYGTSAVLFGCSSLKGVPDRLFTVEEETAQARGLVPGLTHSSVPELTAQYYAAPARDLRNEIIARRMYIIDVQYSKYEEGLTRENQQVNFIADATSQGLNAAGTISTTAETMRIAGAVAGLVTGVKGTYQSDIVIAKTVQIIQTQMRANRDLVAARILKRLIDPIDVYPLSLALSDVEDYYRAGTLTAGLIKAADSVSTDAKQAKNEKDNTVILTTTFSSDDPTKALLKFLYPVGPTGAINVTRRNLLNAILARSTFPRAPDGQPWLVTQILYGATTADIRRQLAKAAGLM